MTFKQFDPQKMTDQDLEDSFKQFNQTQGLEAQQDEEESDSEYVPEIEDEYFISDVAKFDHILFVKNILTDLSERQSEVYSKLVCLLTLDEQNFITSI